MLEGEGDEGLDFCNLSGFFHDDIFICEAEFCDIVTLFVHSLVSKKTVRASMWARGVTLIAACVLVIAPTLASFVSR